MDESTETVPGEEIDTPDQPTEVVERFDADTYSYDRTSLVLPVIDDWSTRKTRVMTALRQSKIEQMVGKFANRTQSYFSEVELCESQQENDSDENGDEEDDQQKQRSRKSIRGSYIDHNSDHGNTRRYTRNTPDPNTHRISSIRTAPGRQSAIAVNNRTSRIFVETQPMLSSTIEKQEDFSDDLPDLSTLVSQISGMMKDAMSATKKVASHLDQIEKILHPKSNKSKFRRPPTSPTSATSSPRDDTRTPSRSRSSRSSRSPRSPDHSHRLDSNHSNEKRERNEYRGGLRDSFDCDTTTMISTDFKSISYGHSVYETSSQEAIDFLVSSNPRNHRQIASPSQRFRISDELHAMNATMTSTEDNEAASTVESINNSITENTHTTTITTWTEEDRPWWTRASTPSRTESNRSQRPVFRPNSRQLDNVRHSLEKTYVNEAVESINGINSDSLCNASMIELGIPRTLRTPSPRSKQRHFDGNRQQHQPQESHQHISVGVGTSHSIGSDWDKATTSDSHSHSHSHSHTDSYHTNTTITTDNTEPPQSPSYIPNRPNTAKCSPSMTSPNSSNRSPKDTNYSTHSNHRSHRSHYDSDRSPTISSEIARNASDSHGTNNSSNNRQLSISKSQHNHSNISNKNTTNNSSRNNRNATGRLMTSNSLTPWNKNNG